MIEQSYNSQLCLLYGFQDKLFLEYWILWKEEPTEQIYILIKFSVKTTLKQQFSRDKEKLNCDRKGDFGVHCYMPPLILLYIFPGDYNVFVYTATRDHKSGRSKKRKFGRNIMAKAIFTSIPVKWVLSVLTVTN